MSISVSECDDRSSSLDVRGTEESRASADGRSPIAPRLSVSVLDSSAVERSALGDLYSHSETEIAVAIGPRLHPCGPSA
jgi:hypothetical protein